MATLNSFSDDKLGFIANSPSTVHAYALADRISRFNVPVLITGETGTGKECIAKYIHAHAVGSQLPYIGVNCVAIPESMLEAVLFGYEKGAFTGAVNSMPGKFEQANGGTLLLDEIGDMSLTLQAKLLRVLQERVVERLGSTKSIPLDIRLIAMTNKNLEVEIAEGRFRQDLYYRLSVMPIYIAPLRDRPEDIIPLAKLFIAKYRTFHANAVQLTLEGQLALCQYRWPGNVRELENIIQRGLIMSNDGLLTAETFGLPSFNLTTNDLTTNGLTTNGLTTNALTANGLTATELSANSLNVNEQSASVLPTHGRAKEMSENILLNPQTAGSSTSKIQQHGQFAEYQYIVDLLKQYKGNKSRTAKFLGITPRALRYRLASMRANGFDLECYT